MGKILIVSTVSRQFYLFEQGNIEVLKSMGYEVHGAANFEDANERLDSIDIIRHHIDIQRSPFSLTNIKALYQLRRLMKSYRFDAVHCHTPMGGVLARLVSRSLHVSPVIYTAQGSIFTRSATRKLVPILPVEWWLSRYTDAGSRSTERLRESQAISSHKCSLFLALASIRPNLITGLKKEKKRRELE